MTVLLLVVALLLLLLASPSPRSTTNAKRLRRRQQNTNTNEDGATTAGSSSSCDLLQLACQSFTDLARCSAALSGCAWDGAACFAKCKPGLTCFAPNTPNKCLDATFPGECNVFTACTWTPKYGTNPAQCSPSLACVPGTRNSRSPSTSPVASGGGRGSDGEEDKEPTARPTVAPTPWTPPTNLPTSAPLKPTPLPTDKPTPMPTDNPVQLPPNETRSPTRRPRPSPTFKPTKQPRSAAPTREPVPRTPKPTRPTKSPTAPRTRKPSQAPTSLGPTFAAPTNRPTPPTPAPTKPTPQPTVRKTNAPTGAPAVPSCQRPPVGSCASLVSLDACAQYSGCTWTGTSCSSAPCDAFDCGIKSLAFQAASSYLLPGCNRADSAACSRQRLGVYTSLGLDACPDVGPNDSATMTGTESEPVPFARWSDDNTDITSDASSASSSTTTTAGTPPPTTGSPTPAITDIFVAPETGSGSDLFSGLSPNRALATLARAVQLARTTGPRTTRINLIPGTHRLAQPVVLSALDSGITIRTADPGLLLNTAAAASASNTQATISGRVRLPTTWTDTPGPGGATIKSTPIPTTVAAQLDTLSVLSIDGVPQIRARFPNAATWFESKFLPSASIFKYYIKSSTAPLNGTVMRALGPSGAVQYQFHTIGYNGACTNQFSPAAGYFCHPKAQAAGGCPYSVLSGAQISASVTRIGNAQAWGNSASGSGRNRLFFHAYHPFDWAVWTFEATASSSTPGRLFFTKGGWQEARGDCELGGGEWFAENALVMLDAPGEYYLDLDSTPPRLWFSPPTTTPWLGDGHVTELTTPNNVNLLVVQGGATDVSIHNVAFSGTHPIHMIPHEIPSGGDWSVYRSGAVFAENVKRVRVWGCRFTDLGGHGVFLSREVGGAHILSNEFVGLGGSAVLSVGDPLFDSPTPWDRRFDSKYPSSVLIDGNVASRLGVLLKQSSGAFVAVSKDVTISNNVFYDGPRAGITFNDGFGGGHVTRRNIVFNMVTETNDHGPFNAWDRQRYMQPQSMRTSTMLVEDNFLIGNPTGPKGIDLDDGALNYVVTNNVIAYGYVKFKGANIRASGNLIMYPPESGCVLVSPQSVLPAKYVYTGNTCVTQLAPYAWQGPSADLISLCAVQQFQTARNTQYLYGGSKTGAYTFSACTAGGPMVSWNTWRNGMNQDADSRMFGQQPDAGFLMQQVKRQLPFWFGPSSSSR